MKTTYSYQQALDVARDLVRRLAGSTDRIEIAGSLRRQKPRVSDIELLYIPKYERRQTPEDMFLVADVNLATEAILELIRGGILAKRLNKLGRETFGTVNQLCVHVPTGIPVDLFAANLGSWENYLVCRTGPAELNTRIATLAKAKGWRWNPYGLGFMRLDGGENYPVHAERDVFDFVGLPYLPPETRQQLAEKA